MEQIKPNTIYCGDSLEILKTFPNESVNCCITSPPYFNLREYPHDKQMGLEETPELYIYKMVAIFSEVKRVLKKNGTCWINIGDSYAGSGRGNNTNSKQGTNKGSIFEGKNSGYVPKGLKPKDLMGIPWRLAFALQDDGWWLRSDIIWNKTNCLPESVKDRCTRSHEYVFMLTKSAKYWYDADAIKEPAKQVSIERLKRAVTNKSKYVKQTPGGQLKQGIHRERANCKRLEGKAATTFQGGDHLVATFKNNKVNKRSVWNVPVSRFRGNHFATFPESLIMPMVKSGCPENGIIIDPFMGAGTTAVVSKKLGRKYVGIEISESYVKMANKRIASVNPPLFVL